MTARNGRIRASTISVNSLTFCVLLASLHAKPLLGGRGAEVERLSSEPLAQQPLSGRSALRAGVGGGVRLLDSPMQPASGANHARGPLAQLAEQLTLNQQVRGSSPWRLTSFDSRSGLPELPRLSRDDVGSPAFLSSPGEVSELADEHDLGSCAARRRSSSLLFPTKARPTANRSVALRTLEPQASLKEFSYG